jgi:hypothetical protein
MKRCLLISVVLLAAATLLVFASCDNSTLEQIDRIALDADPSDFDAGDVSGTIPSNADEAMNALGEVMMPAMEGVALDFESEFEEITCFDWFFDWFFEPFIGSMGESLATQAITAEIDWEQVFESKCQGTVKIKGNETVVGYNGTASLSMPGGEGAVFALTHGSQATWIRGEVDINTIDLSMTDFEAEEGDPIVNALGILFSDVDVKLDLSNLNIVENEPTGWIEIVYGAFDIQTEIILAAANDSGYGGIFWLDFKVWIPPQTVTLNMESLLSGSGESGPDPETIINAIAPGLSVYLSVKVYEGPLDDTPLEVEYDLEEVITSFD